MRGPILPSLLVCFDILKVTLVCVLERSFLWPLMRESCREKEIQPQQDPIEGIGSLSLVLMGSLTAVLVAAPIVGVLEKLAIQIWPTCKIIFFFKY